MQHKALVGFDQKNSGAARAIQNHFVIFLQPVEPLPTQNFAKHHADNKMRGVNRDMVSLTNN